MIQFKAGQKPKEPKPKRKPVLPVPDIWPEHIQETLKARELGLPEPEAEEPDTLTRLAIEESKPKEKKQKKKKAGISPFRSTSPNN